MDGLCNPAANTIKHLRMHPQFHNPHQQHFHYHYHYHYDTPPTPPHSLTLSSRSPKATTRMSSPRPYASTIETNHWKQHVNPEVSRLYQSIHPRQSPSLHNRISEEDSIVQDGSPPASRKRLLQTQCGQNTTVGRPLSKLQSLYYSKQRGETAQEIESIAGDPEDAYFSAHEEKLKSYRRQIDRLKRIEQECEYLREYFMQHIENRHPQQLP